MNSPGELDRGLVIYTRRDCSLCEVMASGVRRVTGSELPPVLVEIDDDPVLVARFGPHIPVLCLDDEVICKHFLDEARLRRALAARPRTGRP